MKLTHFDTIILDLDFTVWKGSKEQFWAKLLQFPITRIGNVIRDSNKDSIRLDDGIYEGLKKLRGQNKNLGFITRGGLENVPYDDQPAVICLRLFQIHEFFNYERHVLYKTDLKSRYLKPLGKTIYIDDNETDLKDITTNCKDVTVVNRLSFKEWSEVI